MHWFGLILATWFVFGIVTVATLFWICKRSGDLLDRRAGKGSATVQRPEFSTAKLSGELRSI